MSPAIGAAVPALLYLVYVARYSVNVPFADDWNVIPLASNALHGHMPLGDVWAQYANTRLFIPNLFFAGFGRFTHLNERLIVLFSATIFIATFVMLLALFRAYLRRPLTFVPVLSLGVVWFSVADVQNSLWSFQLAWYLVLFFFVAMCCFLLGRSRHPVAFLALGIVTAVLASLTEVQGFAVWAVGLVCLLWEAPRRRRTVYEAATWIAAAALTAAVYFHNFDTNSSRLTCVVEGGTARRCSPTFGLSHPLQLARFVLALVGNVVPTVPGRWIWAHQLLGAAMVAGAVFVVVQSLRQRRAGTHPLPVLLIVFAIQFDLMVAFSRLGVGIAAAGANRYTMPNLILVCGILVYAFAHIRPARRVRVRRGLGSTRPSIVGVRVLIAFVVFQCLVSTQFGLTYGRAQRAYSVDAARVIVNLEAIPGAKRDCYLRAAVVGLPVTRFYYLRSLLIGDELSLFRDGSSGRYLAAGPPDAAPRKWWRATQSKGCV